MLPEWTQAIFLRIVLLGGEKWFCFRFDFRCVFCTTPSRTEPVLVDTWTPLLPFHRNATRCMGPFPPSPEKTGGAVTPVYEPKRGDWESSGIERRRGALRAGRPQDGTPICPCNAFKFGVDRKDASKRRKVGERSAHAAQRLSHVAIAEHRKGSGEIPTSCWRRKRVMEKARCRAASLSMAAILLSAALLFKVASSADIVSVPYCKSLETLFPWGRTALEVGCDELLSNCTRLGWSVAYSCSDETNLRKISGDNTMGSSGIVFDWKNFFLMAALDGKLPQAFPVPRFGIDLLYVSREHTRVLADNVSDEVRRKLAIEFDRMVRPEGMIMSCGPHSFIMITMFTGYPWSVLRSFGQLTGCVVLKKDSHNQRHPMVCKGTELSCVESGSKCLTPIPEDYVPREVEYANYKDGISRDKHMIMKFQVDNVQALNPTLYKRLYKKSNARNYLGRPSHTSSWSAKMRQFGPMERSLVNSGQVRSILDAGAGSCSLEAYMRLHFEGLFKRRSKERVTFVAFDPGYDCAYLDVCGARGSMIYTFGWFEMQPILSESFDMVFQALGIHHSDLSKQYAGFNLTKGLKQQLVDENTKALKKAYNEFDRVLRPGGYLSIHDGECIGYDPNKYVRELQRSSWYNILQEWAQEMQYKVLNTRQSARAQPNCVHVDVILQKPLRHS